MGRALRMYEAKVLAQNPHTRLARTKRSKRPPFHASIPELGFEFATKYADFVSAF